MINKVYKKDCLDLCGSLGSESVDLIYADPP